MDGQQINQLITYIRLWPLDIQTNTQTEVRYDWTLKYRSIQTPNLPQEVFIWMSRERESDSECSDFKRIQPKQCNTPSWRDRSKAESRWTLRLIERSLFLLSGYQQLGEGYFFLRFQTNAKNHWLEVLSAAPLKKKNCWDQMINVA